MTLNITLTFQWMQQTRKGKPDGNDYLFIGNVQQPVAHLARSKSGKQWHVTFDLPGIWTPPGKGYFPYDQAKAEAERCVLEWFAQATAQDPVGDQAVTLGEDWAEQSLKTVPDLH